MEERRAAAAIAAVDIGAALEQQPDRPPAPRSASQVDGAQPVACIDRIANASTDPEQLRHTLMCGGGGGGMQRQSAAAAAAVNQLRRPLQHRAQAPCAAGGAAQMRCTQTVGLSNRMCRRSSPQQGLDALAVAAADVAMLCGNQERRFAVTGAPIDERRHRSRPQHTWCQEELKAARRTLCCRCVEPVIPSRRPASRKQTWRQWSQWKRARSSQQLVGTVAGEGGEHAVCA